MTTPDGTPRNPHPPAVTNVWATEMQTVTIRTAVDDIAAHRDAIVALLAGYWVEDYAKGQRLVNAERVVIAWTGDNLPPLADVVRIALNDAIARSVGVAS